MARGEATAVTHREADNLIATLPQPAGLRLRRKGDWIEMEGGKHGGHSLAVGPSSGARLLVHWKGYVENQGLSIGNAPFAAVLATLPKLARDAYRALCAAKRGLMYGSLVRKVKVGRWKSDSHAELGTALSTLADAGLVTSDNHGRYTAVCKEGAP